MLEIKLDSSFYFPNQIAEGQIVLRIESAASLQSLELRFKKIQHVLLKRIDGKQPEIILDDFKLLRESTHDISQSCLLDPGEYVFPFSIRIKSNETWTGTAKGYMYDAFCQIENNWMLQAVCRTKENVFEAEIRLPILGACQEKQTTEAKIKIGTIFCLFERNIAYKVYFDKPWYFKGDGVVLECFCTTKTQQPIVASINANLYQSVILEKDGNTITKCKLLHSLSAIPINRDRFRFHFRIPTSMGPSITEPGITVSAIIFLEMKLFSGAVVKIKRHLNVGEYNPESPETRKQPDHVHLFDVRPIVDY